MFYHLKPTHELLPRICVTSWSNIVHRNWKFINFLTTFPLLGVMSKVLATNLLCNYWQKGKSYRIIMPIGPPLPSYVLKYLKSERLVVNVQKWISCPSYDTLHFNFMKACIFVHINVWQVSSTLLGNQLVLNPILTMSTIACENQLFEDWLGFHPKPNT
jgi:hypothetical protein